MITQCFQILWETRWNYNSSRLTTTWLNSLHLGEELKFQIDHRDLSLGMFFGVVHPDDASELLRHMDKGTRVPSTIYINPSPLTLVSVLSFTPCSRLSPFTASSSTISTHILHVIKTSISTIYMIFFIKSIVLLLPLSSVTYFCMVSLSSYHLIILSPCHAIKQILILLAHLNFFDLLSFTLLSLQGSC